MAGLQSWNPKIEHMIRGLKPGQFLSGKQCFVGAGPPFLSMISGDGLDEALERGDADFTPGGDVVYPIAMLQTWALSQNKALTRLFEIGSDRAYFATGHAVGQLTLSTVLYHGPNLLRMLYAWYKKRDDDAGGPFEMSPLLLQGEIDYHAMYPWTEGDSGQKGIPATYDGLPIVEIPPGHDNLLINLASDLFDLPFGMLFLLRDTQGNNIAAFYLEQCMSPNVSFGLDSTGLLVQESTVVHYERLVPIPVRAVGLLHGLVAPPIDGGRGVYGG